MFLVHWTHVCFLSPLSFIPIPLSFSTTGANLNLINKINAAQKASISGKKSPRDYLKHQCIGTRLLSAPCSAARPDAAVAAQRLARRGCPRHSECDPPRHRRRCSSVRPVDLKNEAAQQCVSVGSNHGLTPYQLRSSPFKSSI